MIELIWVAIAAVGVWNVYVEVKVRRVHAAMCARVVVIRSILSRLKALDLATAERWVLHDELHGSWANVLSNQTDAAHG